MTEKNPQPVTLTSGNLKVATTIPSEIVQLKAAGWRVDEPQRKKQAQTTSGKAGQQEEAQK